MTDVFTSDKLSVTVDWESFTVRCFASANIPSIYIETEYRFADLYINGEFQDRFYGEISGFESNGGQKHIV